MSQTAESASLPPTNSNPAVVAPDPDEAERLRVLLDRQPSCLLRVKTDGRLLAVNDAGMQILGANNLEQILGESLADRLVLDQRQRWSDFASRVWVDTSGSLECTLVDAAVGDRRVLLQGIALRDHPDGKESVLLTIRDLSATRRLELALEEETRRRQSLEEIQMDLDREVQRDRLAVMLEQSDAERQRIEAEHEAAQAQLEQSLAEAHQQQQKLKERLSASETSRERLVAECVVDRAAAERALGEAVRKVQQSRKTLADQRIEAQGLFEHMRTIEPLAEVGRLALQIAPELQSVVAKLDAQAGRLLGLSSLDANYRDAVEVLRDQARYLASQARRLGPAAGVSNVPSDADGRMSARRADVTGPSSEAP